MFHMVEKGSENAQVGHKTVITYRCFKKFDDDSFLLDLSNSTISEVYNFSEPDAALQHWHETFVSVCDKHTPLKTIRVRNGSQGQFKTPSTVVIIS